jgi:hypothetical protein
MDEEGPSRERIGRERVMGRQRRERRTAIDEDGPSPEGAVYPRSAISGKRAEVSAQSHR